MTRDSVDSVYLSGWEYNRLLQDDPTAPRNSALPAAILWSGAHQLWLFKTIYCTAESYANEVEASNRLNWAMGPILKDLARERILKPVDWSTLPVEAKIELTDAHRDARIVFTPDSIRAAIENGDAPTLELAKAELLKPLLDHLNCVESGAPNSISTWLGGASGSRSLALQSLEKLAQPVLSGIRVCDPPGYGLPPEVMQRQRAAQETVEKPMISQLMSGDGRFSGARGFEPYLRELETVRSSYEPINMQLSAGWDQNKDDLFRLRESASRYVWPDLHSYWLPRLEAGDAGAVEEFEKWIKSAMRLAPIMRYLNNRPTRLAVGIAGPIAVSVALDCAGLSSLESVLGGAASKLAQKAATKRLGRAANLAIFYQMNASKGK